MKFQQAAWVLLASHVENGKNYHLYNTPKGARLRTPFGAVGWLLVREGLNAGLGPPQN